MRSANRYHEETKILGTTQRQLLSYDYSGKKSIEIRPLEIYIYIL